MEKIVVCLKEIESEYETKILDLKNIILTNLAEKITPIEEDYFLRYCSELQVHIKEIDEEFNKKLNILHKAWIEDYNKIYDLCIKPDRKSFLFKKKISTYQSDRLQAYYDDLEATTKSIKNVIKNIIIKVSSLQIQEFLGTNDS